MQKHWDVMRTDDAGESWHEISGNLPSDFGFAMAVHAHDPDTVYASGGATTIWVNFPQQKAAPLPDWLRQKISE